MNTPSIQLFPSKYHSLLKRNQGSLKKWLIPGLDQGKYKINLENPEVKSKDVLKDL